MIRPLATVQTELTELEAVIRASLAAGDARIDRVLDTAASSGGKRLRPGIFLTLCRILGAPAEHRMQVAAALECVHVASLLHDDVIDGTHLRRHKPTLNSCWGNQTAILAGDLVFATACELLADTGVLRLVSNVARCIRRMSESEILQDQLAWSFPEHSNDYYAVIAGKTAELFATTSEAAAILAGCTEAKIRAAREFGLELGTAFQIADDCLDILGNAQQLGKPVGSDLREGKLTLPYQIALDHPEAGPRLRDLLAPAFAARQISDADAERVLALVVQAKGPDLALTEASQRVALAQRHLAVVSSDTRCSQALDDLTRLLSFTVNRNH